MAMKGNSSASAARTEDGARRPMLLALAVCCTVPMAGIVIMTAVLGIAVGWAASIALGVVAAGVCIAVMWQRGHRGGAGSGNDGHGSCGGDVDGPTG